MDSVEFSRAECFEMLEHLEFGIELAGYYQDPATQFRMERMFDLISRRLGIP